MSTKYVKFKSVRDSIVLKQDTNIEAEIEVVELGEGNLICEWWIELRDFKVYSEIPDWLIQQTSTSLIQALKLPVSCLSHIPDTDVAVAKIVLQTTNFDTGEIIYTDIRNLTIYVPEEFKPDISELSVKMRDINNYIVDYALYGLTFPEFNAIVTPHASSPIKKYRITGGGIDISGIFSYSDYGTGYNFSEYGTVVKTWSNTTFKLTVEDERGRTASMTSDEFYIQPYNRPLVKSLIAYRTDKDGITKPDGDYIKVTVDAAASSIKDSNELDKNTLYCYLDWKEVNGSYSHFREITNKEPYIFEADKNFNFEIKCELRDKYMKTVAYCNVISDEKDFNIADGGGGAAIGTKAVKGYFDVAYNSRFQKGVSANEEISSKKGLVSTGTNSKGDFLSFGKAERIETLWHYIGGNAANGVEVDSWGDFNDCTNIGMYCVYYNSDVSSNNYYRILNAPCEQAGTLRVFYATGNTDIDSTGKYLMQEYVVYDGSAVYRRYLSKLRDNSEVEWPSWWTFGDWYCYAGTKI